MLIRHGQRFKSFLSVATVVLYIFASQGFLLIPHQSTTQSSPQSSITLVSLTDDTSHLRYKSDPLEFLLLQGRYPCENHACGCSPAKCGQTCCCYSHDEAVGWAVRILSTQDASRTLNNQIDQSIANNFRLRMIYGPAVLSCRGQTQQWLFVAAPIVLISHSLLSMNDLPYLGLLCDIPPNHPKIVALETLVPPPRA